MPATPSDADWPPDPQPMGPSEANIHPDLAQIGASKASVKFGFKLSLKNGELTSLITEAGLEGTIEVTVEFQPSQA